MREFLAELDRSGELAHVTKEVSARYEIAAVASKLDGKPVLFEKVGGSDYRVVTGICGSREMLARALGTSPSTLLPHILQAIEEPKPFRTVEGAPCQEVVEPAVELRRVPVHTHSEKAGGP